MRHSLGAFKALPYRHKPFRGFTRYTGPLGPRYQQQQQQERASPLWAAIKIFVPVAVDDIVDSVSVGRQARMDRAIHNRQKVTVTESSIHGGLVYRSHLFNL